MDSMNHAGRRAVMGWWLHRLTPCWPAGVTLHKERQLKAHKQKRGLCIALRIDFFEVGK
jgi:hypothetical protein